MAARDQARRAAAALAALGAGVALGFAAFAGGHLAVATVAVVVLYAAVASASPRVLEATAMGFSFGVGFAVVTCSFVPVAYVRTGGSTLGGWLLYGAVVPLQALAPALGCALHRAGGVEPAPARFALALAVGFACVPAVFPWNPSAMALGAPHVAFGYALAGSLGGDLALALPVLLVLPWPAPSVPRALLGAAVLAAAGVWAVRESHAVHDEARHADHVRVGVLQPAVALGRGRDPAARRGRLAALRSGTARLVQRGLDVVVWPESAHPFGFYRGANRDHPFPRDTGIERANGPLGSAYLLAGATTEEDRCTRWNGAVALDPAGRVAGLVDKQRRMPFGDFVPLLEVVRRRARCSSLREARFTGPLREVPGSPGVLVCYDEVAPTPARRQTARGAQYLVAMTNDAWYEGTGQPALQELHVRMRALETGRDVVRAANLRGSFHATPDGTVRGRLPEGVAARGIYDVPLRNRRTVATRLGVVPLLVACLVLVVPWVQRRSSAGSGGR